MKILWDSANNDSNRRKHGVSFEDASVIFTSDEDRLEIYDDAHSAFEDRFLALGPTTTGIVVVVYTEPREDVVRIISARRATRREMKRYAEFTRRWKR